MLADFDNAPDLALAGRKATRFASWHRIRAFLGARNDAGFVDSQTSLPPQSVAGAQYSVTVAVRKTGIPLDPVAEYALGSLDSQGRPEQFMWVRREVPTGEVLNLNFVPKAPDTAGRGAL